MENYGDFCGFTFNGYHSTDFGIIRVSNGSRYTETITPTHQDQTIKIPGGDGTYFFGSKYTQKTFSLNVAFDSMSELQLRQFRQVFNGKAEGSLIFDEWPYKAYSAKIQTPVALNYVPFSYNNVRVYKGEATIPFVCYYPYARSVYKWLNLYSAEDYPTKSEWSVGAGLKANQGTYDIISNNTIPLWNGGDIDTDWTLYFTFVNGSIPLTQVTLLSTDLSPVTLGVLQFSAMTRKTAAGSITPDVYIGINSKTNLVEGYDSSYVRTGTLYNSNVTGGDFFKIPRGESVMTFTNGAAASKIEYNYLYY